MDRLRAMEIFVRVVEAGSMTKAAETLSLQKSAVSMAIKQLERHLAAQLIVRSTRYFSLTDDGRAYYERSLAVLAEIEAIESSLGSNYEHPAGRIRVDMPGSIASSLVLPNLSEFARRYPAIQIALGVGDRRVDLVREAVDCVLRTGELDDASLVSRRIGSFNWIVCASGEYLKQFGAPGSPGDLTRHRIVGYFQNGSEFRETWKFNEQGRELPVPLGCQLAVNDTAAYVECALNGHGLIRIADYLATPMIEKGALREVLADFRGDPVPVFALYPPSRHLSPCVRIFLDWAAQLFAARRHPVS
ncbi:LysR family transcriptional regulator [Kaistia sp. 32K]|uniref:LysR family transcriptional regulator n=1 Tax=Kaistia sp. 32K TaxID=2795690 RepID=UPI00191551B1|nr:LysR family transcriptional regulator [Kaistia sp. 32K]BCP55208.1 LysR family transcriptional regulator [Kaistia sp. 32K]